MIGFMSLWCENLVQGTVLVLQIWRICSMILFIWVVSILAILPAMFNTGTYDIYFPMTDLPLYHLCMEQWPQPIVHTSYSFALMMVRDKAADRLLPLAGSASCLGSAHASAFCCRAIELSGGNKNRK